MSATLDAMKQNKSDNAEPERVISAIKKLPQAAPRPPVQRTPISRQRIAAAKMLEGTLVEAGLDIAKFNGLMAQDQCEAREYLRKGLVKPAADVQAAAQAAHRERTETYAKLGKLVTPDLPPPQVITLPQPVFVQVPAAIEKDIHVAPGGSNVKLSIDTDDNNNYGGIVSFWYVWKNDSAFDVIISALSDVIINGTWYLEANPGELWGLLGSDSLNFQMGTSFQTWRYSGWGNSDNTPYPLASGSTSFLNETLPQNSSYGAQGTFDYVFNQPGQGAMFVPAGASLLFKVMLIIGGSGFSSGGGNTADQIKVDLNSDGYGVFCPSVWIEIWLRYKFPFNAT